LILQFSRAAACMTTWLQTGIKIYMYITMYRDELSAVYLEEMRIDLKK
jgi:hypothetical protein